MQETKGKNKIAQAGKYLTFKLGDEDYGVEIQKVIEIIGLQDITPVPRTPDYVRGVINLRGIIHPVIDLNQKFDMGTTEETDLTCIIVVTIRRNEQVEHIGIIVDQVSEVEDIKEEAIENTPNLGTDVNAEFIMGMAKTGNRVKLLLDLQKVLTSTDIKLINKISDEQN